MIKFAVLRSNDGHATDPLLPNSTIRMHTGGHFEVLTTGKADSVRVTVKGKSCEGGIKPRWPDDLKAGKVKVVIEQIVNGTAVDSKRGEVEVIDPENVPAAEEIELPADAGKSE